MVMRLNGMTQQVMRWIVILKTRGGLRQLARILFSGNKPTLDDFETYPYLWSADENVVFGNPEFALGDPGALTLDHVTVSNNLSNDVGGGLRLLGNADITNSTISGNVSTGWYGGAFFLTDGVVNMINSTVADNISPPGAWRWRICGPHSANRLNSIGRKPDWPPSCHHAGPRRQRDCLTEGMSPTRPLACCS